MRAFLTVGAVCLTAGAAEAGGSLRIPTQIGGLPTNVGLLILGHSTSAQGDYPAKLAAALNHPGNAADGRNYVVVRAITGGDGGFLWSRLSVPPSDVQYDRVQASAGPTATGPQWCEDGAGVRWSCRRAKAETVLTGANALPASGTCAAAALQNGCSPGASMTCTWFDRTIPPAQNPVTQVLTPHECWMRMDYHLVLVQDTSNRSWPVDDYDANGVLDDRDRWLASRIPAVARPCGGTTGVVGSTIDWDCDGQLTDGDGVLRNVTEWLHRLTAEMADRTRYGAAAAEHVFVMAKPLELGQCNLYPAAEQATCNASRHAVRTPAQIAATPGRPLDHYYVPTVYWEYRVIEGFLIPPNGRLNPLMTATTTDTRAMWDRSARCYAQGLAGTDWTIPATVPGRPTSVAADDSEADGGATPNAASVGCMIADHVHHNDTGGWMMADVWFRGLLPYLQ